MDIKKFAEIVESKMWKAHREKTIYFTIKQYLGNMKEEMG